MRENDFEQLLDSVKEGGAILRGEVQPSRAFRYAAVARTSQEQEAAFAICLTSDDPELLIEKKVYQVTVLGDDLLKVTDEAGEAAIYSAEHFVLVSFPPEVEQMLAQQAKH